MSVGPIQVTPGSGAHAALRRPRGRVRCTPHPGEDRAGRRPSPLSRACRTCSPIGARASQSKSRGIWPGRFLDGRGYMTKTALITGITGQDGSYLAEFLLEQGLSGRRHGAPHQHGQFWPHRAYSGPDHPGSRRSVGPDVTDRHHARAPARRDLQPGGSELCAHIAGSSRC